MAKSKIKAPSVRELVPLLKKEPLPIYYLFGEDKFAIEKATELIAETYKNLIASDFDKETIRATKSTDIEQIIQAASAFPFGDGKKIIIVKQINLIRDKKLLAEYAKNPNTSTILIFADDSNSLGLSSKPYKTLLELGYIFEARQLRGGEWFAWIKSRAKELGLTIDDENAQRLYEIVGAEKQLIMRQLEKIRDYLGEGGTITKEIILKLASPTKTYTTFELQEAFLKGDKTETLKIGYHLLSNGVQLYEILPMLTSAVTILMRSLEARKKNLSEKEAASAIGAHPFYYRKIVSSKFFRTEEKIRRAAEALLEADIAVKTSGGDAKTIFLSFVTKVFG